MTRARGFPKRHPLPGSRPGSIVIPAGSPPPRISVVHYDENDATELRSQWAYPAVWSIMIAVAGGMYIYFWRRGWLGGGDDGEDEEPPS